MKIIIMIILVDTQEVISILDKKKTMKNRFHWPLNSRAENVQTTRSIWETIYKILKNENAWVQSNSLALHEFS